MIIKYLGIACVFLTYFYMFKKHRDIIKVLPLSKERIINLTESIKEAPHKGSLYSLYIRVTMIVLMIILLSLLLKLNAVNTIYLILIIFALFPLVIIWNMNYLKYESEFRELNTYLTQFILIFKSHNKILFTLEELLDSLNGVVRLTITHSIKMINDGSSLEESLAYINDKYPHFITFNLHSLVLSVEKFGSDDYYDALDLIQDDIDDWFDDINEYNSEKRKLINKIIIFILFAFIICYIALKMLTSVDIDFNTPVYQLAIFVFCILQVFTFVSVSSILNEEMIHKSEKL